MKKIIITIDGHSACGKSTLARQLAEKLKYGYIDTGAMYRAVTYYFLENRVNVQKTREVDAALNKIDIHFKNTVGGNRTFLNGVDVEDTIRKMFVSKSVSHVAAMSKVRKKVVKQQQEMGKLKGIVMEGRDIGTVVFPKAELKLFLTANEDIRTQRRFDELKAKGQKVSAAAIKKNLKERDHIDSTREDSPLKQAKEAVLIENSNLTQKEQLAMAFALANERIAALNKVKKTIAKKPVNKKITKPNPSTSKNQSTKKPTTNRANSKTEKAQKSKSSNNKSTKHNQQKTKPTKAQKPKSSNNKNINQQKPKTQKSKSTNNQNRNQQKPKPATKNKPLRQKAVQQKQSSNKKANSQKPQSNKKTSIKQQPKKAKPQTSKKSNNTPSPSKKRPQQNKKQHQSRRPKQNTKKKESIEDLLDDFSF